MSDWDDKLTVNKNENWDIEDKLPETFDQNCVLDPSKVYPENLFNTTDDSDDHEATNSETSEPEVIWQSSLPLPKATSIPNGFGSKIKKPTPPKQAKSPETR